MFGAGRIGDVHARNVLAEPRTELVAVVDVNTDSATAIANKYGCIVAEGHQILNDPEIDTILVASSTDTHAGLIEAGIDAGKGVFCEKPIDLNLERSAKCLAKVAQSDVPVMLGFNRRFDPNFGALKQAFDAGEIGKGEMLSVTSYDPEPPPIAYVKVSGGIFRDMAIHDFDLVNWIYDAAPTHISAAGSCLVDPAIGDEGDVDTAVCVLRFDDGRIATIKNSRRAIYGYDQRVELLGNMGLLAAENERESTVVKMTAESVVVAKPEYFFLERYMRAYRAEWAHFVDSLICGTAVRSTSRDGVFALAVDEAAQEALETGRSVEIRYPDAVGAA